MRYPAYVSLSLFLLASTENASASCLVFNQNERLSNYCLLETLKGKIVDQDTVNILTDRLKQEGYLGGLEKPNWSTNKKPEKSGRTLSGLVRLSKSNREVCFAIYQYTVLPNNFINY